MVFALVGNPNSGKTTLFNTLTDSNQHIGNFPGVTVTKKIGTIRKSPNHSIIDLPGIYSLRPYSEEEIITTNFLLTEKIDGIVNIIDATNIERNLYLTLQLLELKIPIIIALNMIDEIKANNGKIKTFELSRKLGIPIIPISASKKQGILELTNTIINIPKTPPKQLEIYSSSAINTCINTISNILNTNIKKKNIPVSFLAINLIENNTSLKKYLKLNKTTKKSIENTILELEQKEKQNATTILAKERYDFIEKICQTTVIKPKKSKQYKLSEKIDKLLTNKYLALPIFFFIIFIVFWITFNVIGNNLAEILDIIINHLTLFIDEKLTLYKVHPILHSLIIDGIFVGVGSVLSFLPIIVTLFFFLSILEDSGYMARIVFIMDKLLGKIGLSGKSFVPMLIGFGCSVPAIMATRTLTSKRDRILTILIIPFISCSAKIPIYAVLCNTFFKEYSASIMLVLYIIGIIIGIIVISLLKTSIFQKNSTPFVMELPNYRLPTLKNTFLLMRDKAKDFLEKAFTLILLSTIIIWFLQKFDITLHIVQNAETSLLASISKSITPLFSPIGLNDWRIITSLISGIIAKEAVISTLNILLTNNLSLLFTPLTAFCFLIFTLLYTPCFATIATIHKELNSNVKTLLIILFQCFIAWLATFIVFNIGKSIIL